MNISRNRSSGIKRHHQKFSRGFTLIELLAVIAIIGVLSSVILTTVDISKAKARDARRIAEIKQIMAALDVYHTVTGHYPVSTNCGTSAVIGPNPAWCNSVESLSGGHWIRDNGTVNVLAPYFATEPTDPKQGSTPNWLPYNGGTYFYYSPTANALGNFYILVFGLEKAPNIIERVDGFSGCGTSFDYGNATNGIVTLSSGCTK